MTTPLVVAAVSLAVIAVVQVVLIVALLLMVARAMRLMEELREVSRNVATAVRDAGQAARQVGDLAGTTRTLATGLLGSVALGRLAPKVFGGFDAARIGFDLARTLVRRLRRPRPKRSAGTD